MKRMTAFAMFAALTWTAVGSAQAPAPGQSTTQASFAEAGAAGATEVQAPMGYVIGAGDVPAAGQTPQQLGDNIKAVAKRWVQDPNVTVIIRQINSRAVFITGRVAHAGRYPLNGTTSVLQLIAMAGGLSDWADAENVTVMRADQTGFVTKRFNYKDVIARKNLEQNIELQPGDTVIVP